MKGFNVNLGYLWVTPRESMHDLYIYKVTEPGLYFTTSIQRAPERFILQGEVVLVRYPTSGSKIKPKVIQGH